MDYRRFDAWTRRRFGLAAGGVIALALRLHEPLDTAARNRNKKKRRRKRCRKAGSNCVPGARRKCCQGLLCGPKHGVAGSFCCKGAGATCTSVGGECCLNLLCVIETGSKQGVCGTN